MDSVISLVGGFIPPYVLTDAVFLQEDIITIDERGTFVGYTLQREQTFEQRLKCLKLFSFNISSAITTTNIRNSRLFYACSNGKIGVIRTISR